MHLAVNQKIRFESVKQTLFCALSIWLRSAVGLTRRPVTAKNTGSSPVGVAIQPHVKPD